MIIGHKFYDSMLWGKSLNLKISDKNECQKAKYDIEVVKFG